MSAAEFQTWLPGRTRFPPVAFTDHLGRRYAVPPPSDDTFVHGPGNDALAGLWRYQQPPQVHRSLTALLYYVPTPLQCLEDRRDLTREVVVKVRAAPGSDRRAKAAAAERRRVWRAGLPRPGGPCPNDYVYLRSYRDHPAKRSYYRVYKVECDPLNRMSGVVWLTKIVGPTRVITAEISNDWRQIGLAI
jgi:hypothetical protein